MTLTKEDFEYVQALALEKAAIKLDHGKEYLVKSRLDPVAVAFGFESLAGMIGSMRAERSSGEMHRRAVEALTTNETLFFRDIHPFEALENTVLPAAITRRSSQRKLTLWSGACSTGQEAYSLAMMILERFPVLASWDVSIIATDINELVLERARMGLYSQIEVNRGLPAPLLAKYFDQVGVHWQLKSAIRQMVDFRQMNLAEAWPEFDQFDVVMMRNVLIYFDVETRRRVLAKIKRLLRPDGILFLGTCETTLSLDPDWKVIRDSKAVYFQPN